MKTLVALSLAAFAAPAMAGATVDGNLGTLGAGTINIAGTTVGADNDIDNYTPISNAAAVWGQDRIYQFTTTSEFTISITSNDPNGVGGIDNDFFLVSSLATVLNGNGLHAATSIQSGLDIIEISGNFGTFPAGTYYLVIDAWRGNPNTPGTPAEGRAGAFSVDLTLTATPTPGAVALFGLGGLLVTRRRR